MNPESNQSEQTIPDSYVIYDNYFNGRLSCKPPENKSMPPSEEAQSAARAKGLAPPAAKTWMTIPLLYNYAETTDGPSKMKELLIEGPEFFCKWGLSSRLNGEGKMDHSISLEVDKMNPEHKVFVDTLIDLRTGASFIVDKYKDLVGCYEFDPKHNTMPPMIYKHRDKLTKALTGKESIFFKLIGGNKQTIFTSPGGTVIDWSKLYGTSFSYIPLFIVSHIYVGGGKPSTQMKMESAIITGFKTLAKESRQGFTMNRITAENPNLDSEVNNTVSKLMGKQEEKPQDSGTEIETESGQATFSGIGAPKIASIQDFTAGAVDRTANGIVVPNFSIAAIPTGGVVQFA